MGKKAQKCRKNCTKHSFILKPVDYFAYLSRTIEVSFCPQSIKHHPIFPMFNKDKKHYTSSFFLKQDEAKYVNNDAIYKKEHENFCLQQLNGKSQMLEPKPRTKTYFCHVCKIQYDDYIEHIKSQNHKTRVSESKFSTYIDQLIREKYQDVQSSRLNSMNQDESSFNQKEINSNSTLPPSLNGQQYMTNNHGFTYVSGQGVFDFHNAEQIKKSPNRIEYLLQNRQPISPNFEILLKKCSNTAALGSEKKNVGFTKYPIIVEPPEA